MKDKRYTGFWHSSFINWLESKTVALSSYLWRKRWANKNSTVVQKNLEVA